MTLIDRIKRYFARQMLKFSIKLHYSDSENCKFELESVDKYYNIFDSYFDTINEYSYFINVIFSEYMQGIQTDADVKESIDAYIDDLKRAQTELKKHLRRLSNHCRLFLFFSKKGCIKEYYPEKFRDFLKKYKVLAEPKINYDPYLDFKRMKVEKKKKDLEKDFH